MRPPPTASYLARAQLAAAALVVLIGVVGGILMQVELAAPGAKWSMGFYNRMLGVHGLIVLAIGAAPFAGVLGYLAVTRLIGATRVPAPAIAWVGFGAWVIGLAFTIGAVLIVSNDTGWTMYTPASLETPSIPLIIQIGPVLMSGAALIYAVHLAVIIATLGRADRLQLAIACGIVIAIAGGGILGLRSAFLKDDAPYPVAFAAAIAVMFATVGLGGPRKSQQILVAIGVLLGCLWGAMPNALTGLALSGIWIALAIAGGFARPAVAFVVFGCAPAIVLSGLAAGVSSDVHLHDTYFAVAQVHLRGAALGFAAFAGIHAWPVLPRVPNTVLAWIGACVCSAGSILHVYAQLVIGQRGMPRRYWDYDPSYAGGFQLSIVGTVVLIVGVIVLAIAWLVGRPRPPTND